MESITVKRLKILLEKENLSANEAAKKAGISSSALYYILDGGQPRKSTIQKIVAAYPNYSQEWLLGADTATEQDAGELQRLREENAWLRQLVERLTTGTKAVGNFLKALTRAGANVFAPVRVGAV